MAVIQRLRRLPPETTITVALVSVAVAFIGLALQPALVLSDTLPAGGDMGAHVWGPAFLRDHLLSDGRLTGWSPDWYAGFPAYHFYMVVPSLLIVALDVLLPYGIAFKLVTVSGLLAMPVAAWALGRLARLPFPGPALLAVGATAFVFDRSFTIYGGNAGSTLAGEFAFSISLALAVLFLGLVLRGLDTGGMRVAATLTLALCVLCHIIPAIFAVVGAALALALRADRSRLRWTLATLVVGGALSAFWTLPFLLRRPYLNDMGWEKITTYAELLFPGRLGVSLTRALGGEGTAAVNGDLTWVALLAAVGLGTSIIFRRRLGVFLGLLAVVAGGAFVLAPQGRLWNARLLPFWYLCLYLLAAVAVAELARSAAVLLAKRPDRPSAAVVRTVPVVATLVVLVALGLPLRTLPFGTTQPDGSYTWLGINTADRSFVPDWARWNYSGYEGKDAYPEYRAIIDAMDDIGQRQGCGRAMWEYSSDLDRFGTPMALMLLPYFTGGCIGSMEGLFFEASATTPYHFLNQSELSAEPSRAQRDLPYGSLDVARGVEHLQLMGVRYYMAFTPEILAQADALPELTEVATVEGWKVYEVAGAELVEPLEAEPVVVDGLAAGGEEWLEPAVEWYMDEGQRDIFLAADGPPEWSRSPSPGGLERQDVAPATVSDIEVATSEISFSVDRTGSPVLVKASYFPNWQVSGADGPWRVAPNLMVVVPTSTEVSLTYGTTPVDLAGWLLTLVGLAGLAVFVRRGPLTLAERPARRLRTEYADPLLGTGGDEAEPAEAGEPAASGPDGERPGAPAVLSPDSGEDGAGGDGERDGDGQTVPAGAPPRGTWEGEAEPER
ncbi:MAG TPA: hypothetical protein VNT56_05665 [Acidimicrobiales bacterium]|nr:hypothetical protein [Acidimicrobiales bacterium]